VTSWPSYHQDGGNPNGPTERRQAAALAAVILERWRRDYLNQRPELRRRVLEQSEAI
jgi:hypothetical protein